MINKVKGSYPENGIGKTNKDNRIIRPVDLNAVIDEINETINGLPIPTLQEVTNEGATTDSTITLTDSNGDIVLGASAVFGYNSIDEQTVSIEADSGNISVTGGFSDVNGALKPYKTYVALLSQTGSNAPTVKVLENNLSGSIVWSYTSVGNYRGTLTGAFTVDKTWPIIGNNDPDFSFTLSQASTNQVAITSADAAMIAFTDGVMSDVSIEIRVYD